MRKDKYNSTVAASARRAPVRNARPGRDARPDDAEEQARGERADAERRVVDTERGAARVRRREVGNPRLLHPFGQAEVQTVGEEAVAISAGRVVEPANAEVDSRVEEPAEPDHVAAAEAVDSSRRRPTRSF